MDKLMKQMNEVGQDTGRLLFDRRTLLSGSAAAAVAATSSLAFASAPRASGRDTLVLVYLRGGLDGLSACVPVFESAPLAAQRPDLLVPTSANSGSVDLDGSFSLHPGLAPLEAAYRDGELAVVHAAGSLDPTRSHFAARRAIEAGAIGAAVDGARGGWTGRALRTSLERSASAPRGVALGAVLPRSMSGGPRVVPVNDPRSFAGYGDSSTSARRRVALAAMSSSAASAAGALREELGLAGASTIGAFETLGAIDFNRTPAAGAAYPSSTLGGRLFDAATLVREDVGTEVIHIDTGDWDDHDDMGPNAGGLASRLDDLGRGLAAFQADIGGALSRTTVVVYSEFGRRVDQNGSRGTDHGRGGLALVLGGNVLGGRVISNWPGVAPADLDDGALRVTTDLRDVFTEVLAYRLGVRDIAGVFPGHAYTPVGLIR